MITRARSDISQHRAQLLAEEKGEAREGNPSRGLTFKRLAHCTFTHFNALHARARARTTASRLLRHVIIK